MEDNSASLDNAIQENLASIWQKILDLKEPVNHKTNFFEVGGHSLSATLISLEYFQTTGFEIPVNLIVENPIFLEQATQIDKLIKNNKHHSKKSTITISKKNKTQSLQSYQQKQLWLIDKLMGKSSQYNIPIFLQLKGKLDVVALERALNLIVERHEILRTVYFEENGFPIQKVKNFKPFPLVVVELHETLSNDDKFKKSHKKIIEEVKNEPFDLARDLMLRVKLIKFSNTEYELLMCVHHIAFDGWSTDVFFNELNSYYTALILNQNIDDLSLPIQYIDYAVWQKKALAETKLEKLLSFWKDTLHGISPLHGLPIDKKRPNVMQANSQVVRLTLEMEVVKKLKELAKINSCTFFVVLHAILSLMLYRYSRDGDVVVGTAVANRDRPELKPLIGYFVNSIVLRIKIDGAWKLSEYLSKDRSLIQNAFDHQQLPFELLVESLKPDRSLSYNPIFQIMFVLQNAFGEFSSFGNGQITVKSLPAIGMMAKFDLTLIAYENSDGLVLDWEYNTALFEQETIIGMAEHFKHLAKMVSDNPDLKLNDYPLSTREESQKVKSWNANEIELSEISISDCFDKVVKKREKSVALTLENDSISYLELFEHANRLANLLKTQLEINSHNVIAICLPRSFQLIYSLLAVLKAGCSYVPLDPNYPKERLNFILNDSGASLIITCKKWNNLFEGSGCSILVLDNKDIQENLISQLTTLPTNTQLNNRVCLIYTSGSTGEPKGVWLLQEGILRLALNGALFPLEQETVMLQAASISFDATIFEIWGCLLQGGRLVLYPDAILDTSVLYQILEEYRINTAWLTAGALEGFAMTITEDKPLHYLQYLVTGGDVVPPAAVKKLYANNPNLTVINGYGPTENTCFTCCYKIPRNADFDSPFPVGAPIANTQLYVIDVAGLPAGIGVPGELVVAGKGVAEGYHQRSVLNKERFIKNLNDKVGHYYKTGDLVSWKQDGTVRFLGRIDNQVKVRGFRIELEEIEAVFQLHPSVNSVVITVGGYDAQSKILVAWIVLKKNNIHDMNMEEELKQWISARLPEYMLPSVLQFIDEIPLNTNGKIDRKKLNNLSPKQEQKSISVLSETGKELALIWQRLLKLDFLPDADANFFALGGNSLLAMQLASEINNHFKVSMTIRDIFISKSLSVLSEKVSNYKEGVASVWHALTPLSHQGSLQVYCVPGIGATSAGFKQLALNLENFVQIYAFEPKGIDGKNSPYKTMEEIVSDYVNALYKNQSEGVYYLIGHSFGGRIAFEMAKQLERDGKDVSLILLDVLLENTLVDVSFKDAEFNDIYIANWLVEVLNGDKEEVSNSSDPFQKLESTKLISANQVPFFLKTMKQQFIINQNYLPISSRVGNKNLLIYAHDSWIGMKSKNAIKNNISAWCPNIELKSIAGDHFSILASNELSKIIKKWLEQ